MSTFADAAGTAQRVREGTLSAVAAVDASLARIAATEPGVNAFTAVLAERARKRAAQIDKHVRRRELSLAGVPFAVKNLFDVAGLPTLAGSKIERDAQNVADAYGRQTADQLAATFARSAPWASPPPRSASTHAGTPVCPTTMKPRGLCSTRGL